MARRRIALAGGILAIMAIAACDSVALSPPGAAVLPSEGESIAHVKRAHIGSTNPGYGIGDCPSEGWGWHFVLQGSQTDFVSLVATFTRNGQSATLSAEEFEPTEKHAYVYTDGPGWELTASEAIVIGPDTEYNLSHVCPGPGGDTTTTAAGDTTTSAGGDTTTSAGGDTTTAAGGGSTTTIDRETTITQGGDTSTTEGGSDTSTTAGGNTSTTGGSDTTTTIGDVTITTDPGATTTSGEGPPVTEGGGGEAPTTTVEVGAGGLTTTPDGQGEGEGEGEGTLDPSQETSTTGDEVAGVSDEPFPIPAPGRCRSAVWPGCRWRPEPSCCCSSVDGLERTDPASQPARRSSYSFRSTVPKLTKMTLSTVPGLWDTQSLTAATAVRAARAFGNL